MLNHIIFFIPFVRKRRIIINLLFRGIDKKDLEKYYLDEYKTLFLKNLTALGQDVIRQDNKDNVLLTGCVEIPAIQIAELFRMEVICTGFEYELGRITGVKNDTFGNLKKDFIVHEKGQKTVYYTDDIKSESELEKIMDKIIIVQ